MNGIVELTETSLIEKYKVEEKVPKKKEETTKKDEGKKDEKEGEKKEEEEFEIKIKDKTRTTDIVSEANYLFSLDSKTIDNLFNIEAEMNTHDRIILETNMRKNELETFCYEWKDKLHGMYAKYEVEAKK